MLEENWDAALVFKRCHHEYVAGFAGAFALGFNAREIEAACRLAGVARGRWPEVSEQVQEMGTVSAHALNARKGA